MTITSMQSIGWDAPARSDPAVTAFLHSEFTEDTGQSESFTHGFTAIRRYPLVALLKKYGVALEREDWEKEKYVQLANIEFARGTFGDPKDWLARAQPGGELEQIRQLMAASEARADKLEAQLAKFLAPPEAEGGAGIIPETPAPVPDFVQPAPDFVLPPLVAELPPPDPLPQEPVLPLDTSAMEWNELQKYANSLELKSVGIKRPELEASIKEFLEA